MLLDIMARDIVKNLKFKKYEGKFDVKEFAQMLDDAYRATKRPDGEMTKKSFSPSSLGYGHGNCPRYWYMAFSGAYFIDNNDAQAIANMAHGTQAHERIQKLIKDQSSDLFKTTKINSVQTEVEITNEYPPIKGFIDLIIDWDGTNVIGEIKPFIDDMAQAYADADLVICRSGAMTVSEIAAAGVAACFVPFPHAIDDHQTANARFLSDAQAAILIPQTKLNSQSLADLIQDLSRFDLSEMAQRAQALAKHHATDHVAKVCMECAR